MTICFNVNSKWHCFPIIRLPWPPPGWPPPHGDFPELELAAIVIQLAEPLPESDIKLQLTAAEIRLCKLLRLDLKSSEIARLFCPSERTIETQRLAIRKKLGLKQEDSIAEELAKL